MASVKRIVLSGGASGGHTFPLIAVSRSLRKKIPEGVEFLFIGARGSFDDAALRDEGIPVKYVWSGKMRRYFSFMNFVDIFKLPIGFVQALWHLLWFLPDAVFSKGGAAAVPVVLAARLYRIPVLTQDADAVAGRANRFLAKYVQKIAVAYPSALSFFPPEKTALTGNPVREEILSGNRDRACQILNLDPNKKTVLVLGGSLGAQGLNDAFLRALPMLLEKDVQVIHQTGVKNLERVKALFSQLKVPVGIGAYRPVDFFQGTMMGDILSLSDVVVSRAGANAISEIAANKKGLILVPLPSAANDEQRRNAYGIAEIGGALVLEESNLGEHLLSEKILQLLNNDGFRAEMGEKLSVFYHPDAADRIADGVISLFS